MSAIEVTPEWTEQMRRIHVPKKVIMASYIGELEWQIDSLRQGAAQIKAQGAQEPGIVTSLRGIDRRIEAHRRRIEEAESVSLQDFSVDEPLRGSSVLIVAKLHHRNGTVYLEAGFTTLYFLLPFPNVFPMNRRFESLPLQTVPLDFKIDLAGTPGAANREAVVGKQIGYEFRNAGAANAAFYKILHAY